MEISKNLEEVGELMDVLLKITFSGTSDIKGGCGNGCATQSNRRGCEFLDKAIEIVTIFIEGANNHITEQNKEDYLETLKRSNELCSDAERELLSATQCKLCYLFAHHNLGVLYTVFVDNSRDEAKLSEFGSSAKANRYQRLAHFHSRMGDNPQAAISYLDEVLQEKFDPGLQFLKTITLHKLQRKDEALASLKSALTINADLTENERQQLLSSLNGFSENVNFITDGFSFWYWLARELYRFGKDVTQIVDPDNAVKLIDALANGQQKLKLMLGYHRFQYQKGLVFYNQGRYEEAIKCFDKAIEIFPLFHDAWLRKGLALNEIGRYTEAILSFDRAIELELTSYDAWNHRGLSLYELFRCEEAIESFNQAMLLKEAIYEAWYNRGNALKRIGRYSLAIKDYENALETVCKRYLSKFCLSSSTIIG